MDESTEPRLVSFPDLVAALDLETIQYYELGARLFTEQELETPPVSSIDDVTTNWALQTRHEGNQFGVRVRAEATNKLGVLVADTAIEYVSEEPVEIDRDTEYMFVNDVALMQVFPYIREAFTTLSTRVFGQGLVMPIIRRGQLAFTPPE